MELEQIITLLNAGYTKGEIERLSSPTAVNDPEPADADPEPIPADPEPAPAPAPVPAQNDQILEALNKLTNAIMTKNLNVTTAESSKTQTTQDILAKVIAPPRKEK